MPFKCLIIDPMDLSILPMLEGIGIVPVYRPDIQREEVLAILHEHDGLMLRSKLTVDKAFLSKSGNLKFIARAGAGLDQIDIEEAERLGIPLFNASEGNCDAVGEHAIGMLLSLMNNLRRGDLEVRNKVWLREENRGYEIKGKTVGIVGYGYMGSAFAKKISSFECNIIAYDRAKKNFGNNLVKEVSLQELQEESDIVSFHIPLDVQNKGLVNHEYLSRFKKPFWLINTARGEILNTSALIALIQTGKVRGAALDVLENEKLSTLTSTQQKDFEFLANSDKVILSPHVAGWTFESYYKINETLVRKINNSNVLCNF